MAKSASQLQAGDASAARPWACCTRNVFYTWWNALTVLSTLLFLTLVVLAMLDLLDNPVVDASQWAPILSGLNFAVTLTALALLVVALHSGSASSREVYGKRYEAKVNAAVGKVGLAAALLLTSWVFQNLMSDADGKGFVRDNALVSPDTCTCDTLSDFVRIYALQKTLLVLVVVFVVAGAMVQSTQLWVSLAMASTPPVNSLE